MKKIWTPIPGYENRYLINRDGKILSLSKMNRRGSKFCKPYKTGYDSNNTYLQVALFKDGKIKRYGLHRLIAIIFIKNPLNKPQVNHKDGNKINNKIENLEWVTASENALHALDIGLVIKRKAVLQLSLDGKILNKFKTTREASKVTGIGRTRIYRMCNKKKIRNQKYIWKYEGK